jgi:hypothetical protein
LLEIKFPKCTAHEQYMHDYMHTENDAVFLFVNNAWNK